MQNNMNTLKFTALNAALLVKSNQNENVLAEFPHNPTKTRIGDSALLFSCRIPENEYRVLTPFAKK